MDFMNAIIFHFKKSHKAADTARSAWHKIFQKRKAPEDLIESQELALKRQYAQSIVNELSRKAEIRPPVVGKIIPKRNYVTSLRLFGRGKINCGEIFLEKPEPELRAGFGHEIGHIKKLHSWTRLATKILTYIVDCVPSDMMTRLSSTIWSRLIRKQEFAADRFSAEMNGYETVRASLEKYMEYDAFFYPYHDHHPSYTERCARLRQWSEARDIKRVV